MARRSKPRLKGIKTHRNYTVDEVAKALGVSKGTVRRWIKCGLPVLKERKPMLILGADLVEFHDGRNASRVSCQLHECFCVKCQAAKPPALDMAEFVPLRPTDGNLRALCPTCGNLMHKRIARHSLEQLGRILEITIAQAPKRLTETADPCTNDHFPREAAARAKASR